MRRVLLFVFFLIVSAGAFAQTGKIRGKVVDDLAGDALIGANVVLKGTSTGAAADIDGNFTISDVPAGTRTLVISYIGYESQELMVKVKANETLELGTIKLESSAVGLSEIEVVASIAQDRKTPVAVSNIKADVIETKMGTQEFPEILKVTPGVYATKSGGGFGDSRINLRGFDSQNVAVMINGVPVNDMETGRVYWSNWAGLSDVTQSMQVQRGLGASRVALPSIGGTINILTKTTDAKKGGSIAYTMGNNGFSKTALTLSTGLTENNWAVTISGARTEGDGYVVGTPFSAYSYFFNISKMINDAHTISLTGFGAPQTHGQRYNRYNAETLKYDAPDGVRQNSDIGYQNGQFINLSENFYHKPQFSLNHYWTISPKTEVSNVVYASAGSGGGGRTQGFSASATNKTLPRYGDPLYGAVNLDALEAENKASVDGNAEYLLYATRNDHKWYGALSTLDHKLNENVRLLGGMDIRYYRGLHYYEITNLLGADYYVDRNTPGQRLRTGDKFGRNYDGEVWWEGAFAQAEYTQDKLSAFVSLAGSNTSYTRYEYIPASTTQGKSDTYNFLGYSAKGGANYNLTAKHNVFGNLGYFERAPDFRTVFPETNSNDANDDAVNQKILSFELGYGYRSSTFSANVNLYRTKWLDRSYSDRLGEDQATGEAVYANILGVDALHQGVELDFNYRPLEKLTISGMASVGDWTWTNDVNAVVQSDLGEADEYNFYIAGLKVGDAAQTTAALVVDYDIMEDLTIGMTFNHYDNLYADFNPTDRVKKEDRAQSWKLPSYQLFDASMRYKFQIGSFDATMFGNVNNLFDTEYIADARDGSSHDGLADNSIVYFGFGRTYSLGLKVKF